MPYADNNGVHIYYQDEGFGTPLLLHHPLMGSGRVWYRNGFVDALKNKYQVITMDMRGHGRSDKPARPEDYNWDIRVTDIVAVFDSLDIEKAHYAGYSAGGFGGFATARYAPERLLSLVIGAAHPYGEDSYPIGKNGVDTDVLIDNFAIAAGEPLHHGLKSATLKKDVTPFAYILSQGVPSFEDVLPNIDIPCLLFCGEKDIRHRQIAECASYLPEAQFIALPGKGHLDTFTHIDMILPHMIKFLEECDVEARS